MKPLRLKALTWLLVLGVATWVSAGTWTTHQFIYKPSQGARGELEYSRFNTGLERVDAHLGKYKTLGDPGYSTLSEALATIGSNPVTLIIPAGTVAVNQNTTVPANVTLKVLKGGQFSIADGVTLTINAPPEAGPYQIFTWTGTGAVSFGSLVTEVLAEWFGAAADNSTDSAPAINKAITSLPTNGTLRLLRGTYKLVSDYVKPKNNITIKGAGMGLTVLYRQAPSSSYSTIHLDNHTKVTVADLTINNDDLRLPYNQNNVSANSCIGVYRNCDGIRILRVGMLNSGRYGIDINQWAWGDGTCPKNVEISGCFISGISETGVGGTVGENIRITDNYVENCGYAEIAFEPGQSNHISRNIYIAGNRAVLSASNNTHNYSIYVVQNNNNGQTEYNRNVTIVNNEVIGNWTTMPWHRHAYALVGHSGSVFANNRAYNMGGLVVAGSWHSSYNGNVLYNTATGTLTDINYEGGISLWQGNTPPEYMTIQGNVLHQPSFCGIVTDSSSNNVIKGNVIVNPGFNCTTPGDSVSTGILLRKSANNIVDGNRISDTRGGNARMRYGIIIWDTGAVNNKVSHNQISGTTVGNYYMPGAYVVDVGNAGIINQDFKGGSTSQRPTNLGSNDKGFVYWDTTIGKAIFWNGSAWKLADGSNP